VLVFGLNATLFVLLGLQFEGVYEGLRATGDTGPLLAGIALVGLTVIVVRLAWQAVPLLLGAYLPEVVMGELPAQTTTRVGGTGTVSHAGDSTNGGHMTTTQEPDPFGSAPAAATGPTGPRAGFGARFGAAFIDGLILAVPYLIIAFAINPLLGYAVYLLGGIAYFTYFEGGPTGQTIGKKALGIRVIDFNTGGPIGNGRAFIRYIGRIVSGIPIYLGYFWMLWDQEKQTWHDKMATTVVVPVDNYPVT